MLRARRGSTSSFEIFWLMPAMRRNERSGPGMATLAAAAGADCETSGALALLEVSDGEEDSSPVV
jgi:hypothetical protein